MALNAALEVFFRLLSVILALFPLMLPAVFSV